MDGSRFDRLAKSLSGSGTRRRLLGLATALPVAGALSALLEQAGEAKRPGRNRRAHNHRHSGHRKHKRKNTRKKDTTNPQSGCEPRVFQSCCPDTLSKAGCFRFNDGVSMVWKCPPDTHLENAQLTGCNLIGAIMERIVLTGATLDRAILNNAHFSGSQAQGVHLVGATMVQAKLVSTNLGDNGFRVSNLEAVDARGADFTGASLHGAILQSTELLGANFQDADLRNTSWWGATCPDDKYLLPPFTTDSCCGHLNGHTTAYCSPR